LINNAGVLGPVAPPWQSPPGEWARAITINLVGAYHFARSVLEGMVARARFDRQYRIGRGVVRRAQLDGLCGFKGWTGPTDALSGVRVEGHPRA